MIEYTFRRVIIDNLLRLEGRRVASGSNSPLAGSEEVEGCPSGLAAGLQRDVKGFLEVEVVGEEHGLMVVMVLHVHTVHAHRCLD